MGGRGGSSHAGGEKGRVGRGQLAPFDQDNPIASRKSAILQIMRDLGFDQQKAIAAYKLFAFYFGGTAKDGKSAYEHFTGGEMPKETKKLSQLVLRMPYYNGAIYRGMSFSSDAELNEFMSEIKVGKAFRFKDSNKIGDSVITSWSSDLEKAMAYTYPRRDPEKSTGIIFKMADNKTAAGVRHISKFGFDEDEVLSPAGHNMTVVSKREYVNEHGKRIIEIIVKERGWKKPSEW